jgi:LPXTG-motif cell wall-anchored protein
MAATGTHDHTAFVVFGIFVLLAIVLAIFVVRFAVKLNRERQAGTTPRPRR